MPRYLAEKILTSPSALEGERKQVTVLFADIKGSTELIEGLDPEEAQALLGGAVRLMMEAVHRYEGTVNQVLGDGIMALFGAPLAHEDHAIRACYAALAMQDAMHSYTEETRRRYGAQVGIRVGLNSGEAVVRSIANDLHMDYLATGPTTHLAARMEQAASEGSILLTAKTLALVESLAQVRPLGPIPIKGLARPVEVFELVGVGPARNRLQVAAARGLTRFVGRERELTRLDEVLERVQAGRGQVVAVIGDPGMGKSRFCYEFTHSHRTQGWLILEGNAVSVSYGGTRSYLPMIDLLKTYCGIEARDDARVACEKLIGKVSCPDGPTLEPFLPALRSLLDVEVDDPAWQRLDPSRRRRSILEAIKHLLLRESRRQPLLLVLENLHWIDTETQAVLDSLVESIPTVPLLLLVNYRPEYRHGWGNKTYYTQLWIDPLRAESAEELLGSLLGDDPALESVKKLLIERTQGNPFFLEESIRSLVETGDLVGERGAYHPTGARPSVGVPVTVQAVLAARIDRQPPEEKRLVQAAAVIGKDVPFALLRAVAGLPEEDLRGSLARLQAAEILYEANLFPELEYTFKHALTYQVAYGGLLKERRCALHARIVEALEALAGDRRAEQVERLAYHAVRGEVWPKAVTYLRQAAAKAMARSTYQEASAYLEQALGALEHLPESREKLELAIDLRFELRSALFALGDWGRLLDYVREAAALAETVNDPRRLARASIFMCGALSDAGDHDRAIDEGQRALALAKELGDDSREVTANQFLGNAHALANNYHRAIDFFGRVVASVKGPLRHERFDMVGYPAVLARGALARCLGELGRFDEGITHGEEAIRIGEAIAEPYSLAQAYFSMGHLYTHRGHLSRAIAVLERSVALFRTWDQLQSAILAVGRLGAAYTLAGKPAAGLPLLEQLEQWWQHATTQGRTGFISRHGPWLGEAYLMAGRREHAMQLAERALEVAIARTEPGHEAWALRLLGEIATHGEPPDIANAEACYRRSRCLAGRLGMAPLEAHCHFGLGLLHHRFGRVEQARAELLAAVDLFRSMHMEFWLPRAEAELAAMGGSTLEPCG